MEILIIKEKRTKLKAIQLENNAQSVKDALRFVGLHQSDDLVSTILSQNIFRLPTHSNGYGGLANIGDYIVEQYTEELGTHHISVTQEEFDLHYDVINRKEV